MARWVSGTKLSRPPHCVCLIRRDSYAARANLRGAVFWVAISCLDALNLLDISATSQVRAFCRAIRDHEDANVP
jgi:hypothetical protein